MKRQKLDHPHIQTQDIPLNHIAMQHLSDASQSLYYLMPMSDNPTVNEAENVDCNEITVITSPQSDSHVIHDPSGLERKHEMLEDNSRLSTTLPDSETNESVPIPCNEVTIEFPSTMLQNNMTIDNSSQTDNSPYYFSSNNNNATCENCTQTSAQIGEQYTSEALFSKLQEAQTKIELLSGQLRAMKDVVKKYQNEQRALVNKTESLEKELEKKHFGESYFINSNDKVKYFTGLDTFKQFEDLLNQIKPSLFKSAKLNPFQQCIMTVMKMKHALSNRDLAMKFDISDRTVGRIFYNCLDPLYKFLRSYIVWPSREEIQISLPTAVRDKLGNSILILADVFEVPTEKPTSVTPASSEHQNPNNPPPPPPPPTESSGGVKFAICITAQGKVSFISTGIGGKQSNRQVLEASGALNRLLPNDLVLGSRNFEFDNVNDIHCASVKVNQLTGLRELIPADYEFKNKAILVCNNARQIAKRICQKYSILLSRIPSELLCISPNSEEPITPLDKIAVVICGLTNYSYVPPKQQQQQQQTGFVPQM